MSTALATRGSANTLDLVDPLTLSGRQKAAILCLALGSDVAASITQKMAPEEVDAISFEIARLESVSPDVVDAVLDEWMTRILVADSLAQGGVDAAREILEKAFGARKAQQVLERIQGQLQNTIGLHRLRNADAQQLGQMLGGEHPQTIALILAHLDPQHTAAILKELDTSVGAEVVFRMAKMEKVQPELLVLIERSLSADADLTATEGMSSSGGPAAVASVLNYVASSLEKVLLDGVSTMDQGLCDQIKNLMFVFEDVIHMDDRSIQKVLREVDNKDLTLALKACTPDLAERLLSNISSRAAEMIREELEYMPPVRLREVEEVQQKIIDIIRRLEDEGQIYITKSADEGDMMV